MSAEWVLRVRSCDPGWFGHVIWHSVVFGDLFDWFLFYFIFCLMGQIPALDWYTLGWRKKIIWAHKLMNLWKPPCLHFDGSQFPFWSCLCSLTWIYNTPLVTIDRLFPLNGEATVTEDSGWFFRYRIFPPTYLLNSLPLECTAPSNFFCIASARGETKQETEPFSSSIYNLCSHWRGTRPEWTWWRWSVTGGRSFLQGSSD